MRRLSRLVFVWFLVPGLVFGFQAIGGGRGLFRVQDVKSEGYSPRGLGYLSFTIHALGRRIDLGDQLVGDFTGGIALAPGDWAELMLVSPGYSRRADSVRLIKNWNAKATRREGIERSRLTAIGYGESRLVVQTQEANDENRRVAFKETGEIKRK